MGRSYAPNPVFQFFGDDGKPLVFGFLCTYVAGTNTPVATYDSDGKPNEVRMRLNGRGETDTAIMLDADMAYKFVLLRPDGSEIWTRDNVTASGSSGMAGTDISAEHPITKKMVGSTSLIGFDSTDIDKAISDETKARQEADKSLSDGIGVIGDALSTETEERKAADEELAKAIGGKQDALKDGDNIHIDGEKKVNVVNRRTLLVKSPLTAEKLDTALVLEIRDGAFATAEALEAETAARKTGDEQNRQRIDKVDADLNSEIQNRIEAVSKKQDKYYVFDSSTSTVDDVQSAITDGRTIVSASGSNFVTWQGTIHGGYPTLTRLEEGWQYSWNYSGGKWEYTAKKFDYGTNSSEYNPGVPNPTVVTGPFTATKNLRNTRLLDADGGLIGYLIESLGESGNVLLSSGNSVYWGDAPKEIPGYTKIAYPTSNQTPGDVLFTMGKFNVCGYTDNGGALRLCVVPTDGETHSVSTNGTKATCGTDGLVVATSFSNSSPYMKLYIVDNDSFDICEAEIYAITGASFAASSILYRVITDQTTGGSNG